MDLHDAKNSLSTKDRILATFSIVLIGLVMCWGVIFSGSQSGRGAADDWNFHWLAIQQFADQLPSPDLTDYASATTPGYHLLLSGFARAGIGHTGIQLIASLWTLGLFGLLGWVASARFGKLAIAVVMPVLVSMYVLYPGIWLLPDNAGWVGVLAILLISLAPNPTWKRWVCSGVILFVLVWMRQIHIWAAGVIWLSAWIGSHKETPTLRTLFSSSLSRSGRTCIAIACTLPALGALVWFMAIWGGLVPPTFQGMHQGPNYATPGFILTQLAILSVFFAPILWPRLKEAWKHQWSWVLFAGLVGCILGLVPESSYSYDAGRYGGGWILISKLPTLFDRSPVFILGSIAGAISLVLWLGMISRRDAWIWIGALLAFVAAQSANHASWQRYHEPMLLMMIVLILARSTERTQRTRWVLIGAIALSAMLGALTLATTLKAEPIEMKIDQEIGSSAIFLTPMAYKGSY